MSVVQEAFYIPNSIMESISNGEYIRDGGTVRHAIGSKKGQIVTLLKPVEVSIKEQAKILGENLWNYGKSNKKVVYISGAAIFLVGGCYYKFIYKEPKVIVDFKVNFKEYIAAVSSGKMNLDLINNLLLSLVELKNHKKFEKFKIKLAAEDIENLINHIHGYTIKLVEDNKMNIDLNELSYDSTYNNLASYLNIQKDIFEKCA